MLLLVNVASIHVSNWIHIMKKKIFFFFLKLFMCLWCICSTEYTMYIRTYLCVIIRWTLIKLCAAIVCSLNLFAITVYTALVDGLLIV